MAFRDASISHVKNGIYGEMFVSAMIACAAVSDSIEDIILGGLAEIPRTSRLYEAVEFVLELYRRGGSTEECMARVHELYDEHTTHGWCHTVSNAMIVTMALLACIPLSVVFQPPRHRIRHHTRQVPHTTTENSYHKIRPSCCLSADGGYSVRPQAAQASHARPME